MDEHYLANLITKYINGTATEAEREELLTWYREKNSEELLWPYESLEEEREAKARMSHKINQQMNAPQVSRSRIKPIYYAAVAAVLVIGIFGVLQWRLHTAPQKYNTLSIIKTQRGEHKTVTLSDGSVIWLNSESSLSVPVSFDGMPTREVTFDGEAFFDIAKDQAHPFIVRTGKTSTRVVGTTFNITANKQHENIIVALLTGKVVFTVNNSQLNLMPGNQVIFDKESGSAKIQVIPDVESVSKRHNGYYEYNNVKVDDVLEDIGRNLNINVHAEGPVKKCLFFGRLLPGESAGKFLQKLAIVVNAKLIQSNGCYIIKGGGCN